MQKAQALTALEEAIDVLVAVTALESEVHVGGRPYSAFRLRALGTQLEALIEAIENGDVLIEAK